MRLGRVLLSICFLLACSGGDSEPSNDVDSTSTDDAVVADQGPSDQGPSDPGFVPEDIPNNDEVLVDVPDNSPELDEGAITDEGQGVDEGPSPADALEEETVCNCETHPVCVSLSSYPTLHFRMTTPEELAVLEGCTILESDLLIYQYSGSDLAPLSALKEANSILITESQLIQIEALSNLVRVHEYLRLLGNRNLTSLAPLANLEFVGDTLKINVQISNANLASATQAAASDPIPFTALHTIGNGLEIRMDTLVELNGFSNLVSIGTLVPPVAPGLSAQCDGLCIVGNKQLATINGFGNLATLVGELEIIYNDELEEIAGFESLAIIEGDLSVIDGELSSVAWLQALTSIEGNVTIRLDSLENLDGLSNLNQIGGDLSLSQSDQRKLANLDGLSGITHVPGDLNLSGLYALGCTPDIFNGLLSIGGKLRLKDMGMSSFGDVCGPNGGVLDGFAALETIDGNLELDENYNKTILAFESLQTVGGDLHIVDNPYLESMSGLNHPLTVGGDLIADDGTSAALCNEEAFCLIAVQGTTSLPGGCVPSCGPKENGQSCSEGTQCISEYCSEDGVCSDAPSPCGACGTCQYCDGTQCFDKKKKDEACENDNQCLNNSCMFIGPDGFGSCLSIPSFIDCNSNSDCPSCMFCLNPFGDGGECAEKRSAGTGCSNSVQCINSCVGGTCN